MQEAGECIEALDDEWETQRAQIEFFKTTLDDADRIAFNTVLEQLIILWRINSGISSSSFRSN